MITSSSILVTDCVDPHRNLAMEDAMMQSLPEGHAILFLWQNRHTVVIGAGQNAWRECDTALLEREGGTLARRSSGGGAVYHDLGNLNFSFVVPRGDYDVTRQTRVVLNAVRAHGLNAETSGRNDLTIDGRKFSGNAFRLLKTSALHHGTLLIHSDMEMVKRYLIVPADKLKAKGVKSVPARVTNLDAQGTVTVESMIHALTDAFIQEYGPADVRMADERDFPAFASLYPRYDSWAWNYGASPEGSIELNTRFSWGGVQIVADVVGGAARTLRVYTDSMDETLADRLTRALAGCPWRGEALRDRALAENEPEIAAWLAEQV